MALLVATLLVATVSMASVVMMVLASENHHHHRRGGQRNNLVSQASSLGNDDFTHYSIGEQVYNQYLLENIYPQEEEGEETDGVESQSDSEQFFSGSLPVCERSVATSGPSVREFYSTEYTGFPLHFPSYRQFLKSNDKYVGCGPTAWAMVASWYAHHPSLSSLVSKSNVAINQDKRTNDHMEKIGVAIKSFSNVFMGKNTATMPWDMHHIADMSEYKNLGVDRFYKIALASKKCPLGSHWDCAIARLKQGRPVVIGYGTGVNTHYAMARAYVKHTNGDEWLYLNNGWGGSGNGWLHRKNDIFFAGYFNK